VHLIVTTTAAVGQDLRRAEPTGAAAAIAERIAAAGGELFPQEYAAEQFVVAIADEVRAAQLVDELAGLEGIEAAYPEPLIEGA
jgi:hypothetical protein